MGKLRRGCGEGDGPFVQTSASLKVGISVSVLAPKKIVGSGVTDGWIGAGIGPTAFRLDQLESCRSRVTRVAFVWSSALS